MGRSLSLIAFVLPLAWTAGLAPRGAPIDPAPAAVAVRLDLRGLSPRVTPADAKSEPGVPTVRTETPQTVDNPLAMLMALHRAF